AASPAPVAGSTAGSYNVTATVSGVTAPATFNLTNMPGPPQSVVVASGTPQTATVGTTFASALQAKVIDGLSNPVAGVPVTFLTPSSGASATLSGMNSAIVNTNAFGIAASPVPTANNTGGSYSVTASVAGIGGSAIFNLTNTAPSSIFGAGAPQTFV